MAFIDCTEQQIPRPKNKEENYTIQARKRNILSQESVSVNQKGLIIYKSKRRQIGKRHDYRVYKDNHPDILKEVTGMFDLGFLGVEKTIWNRDHLYLSKRRKGASYLQRKRIQQESF